MAKSKSAQRVTIKAGPEITGTGKDKRASGWYISQGSVRKVAKTKTQVMKMVRATVRDRLARGISVTLVLFKRDGGCQQASYKIVGGEVVVSATKTSAAVKAEARKHSVSPKPAKKRTRKPAKKKTTASKPAKKPRKKKTAAAKPAATKKPRKKKAAAATSAASIPRLSEVGGAKPAKKPRKKKTAAAKAASKPAAKRSKPGKRKTATAKPKKAKKSGAKKGANPWLDHVAAFRKAHPEMKMAEVMKKAKSSYKK